VFLLQNAGIELQDAPKRFWRVTRPVEIREGEGDKLMWARLEPHHGFTLHFEIDFKHPVVDATGQQVSFDMGSGRYKRDIARARTFGFTKDVSAMRARVLNAEGLRYDDEIAKHKLLDAIGDLYIAGHSMLARYTAFRSGHALNNKLLRKLFAEGGAVEEVVFADATQAPTGFAELAPAW
jgi:UDP-3-O-[3-hydroxymyristoyl] N-acetylglucosamine deacetylase